VRRWRNAMPFRPPHSEKKAGVVRQGESRSAGAARCVYNIEKGRRESVHVRRVKGGAALGGGRNGCVRRNPQKCRQARARVNGGGRTEIPRVQYM